MEEFELTYLAKKSVASRLKGCAFKEMLDIYIPSSADHPSLRIRKSGNKLEITKKEPVHGTDSSHQLEQTIPLTPAEYADLATLPGKRAAKNRYLYKEGGFEYEVDVFQGDLLGLVVIDVEFKSNEEKARFAKPDWCLAEVTQEKFIAGGVVCGKKYADLEKDLARYGYEKILL
jgi:CYTH domain-containing protein